MPFDISGGTILAGLSKIKEHFEGISKSPLASLIQIDGVTAKTHFSTPNTLTIEYFTEGKAVNTGEDFKTK